MSGLGLGIRETGDVLVVAWAVGQHPALHRRDELSRVLLQEPVPVRGIPLAGPPPIPAVPPPPPSRPSTRPPGPPAIVRRQRQQAVHPAAYPPDREAGGGLRMAGCGQQRDPGPAGPTGDDGWRHIEVGRATRRARRPAWRTPTGPRSSHRTPRNWACPISGPGCPARPAPREITHAGGFLGEAPAGRDRPGATLFPMTL